VAAAVEEEPEEEEEELEPLIPLPGRLSIKVWQGSDVKKRGRKAAPGAKVDAYVVAQLGDFKKAPKKKTKVLFHPFICM
jgi:hypothetical protein